MIRTATGSIALSVVLLSGLLVSGCGRSSGGGTAAGGGSNDGILRYPIPELTKLDPAVVQDGDSIDAIHNVFEGLVGWNEKSEVAPILAEKWEISPDGRTYTFTLKDGIKFHNGRGVTADDFKWSIERATSPKLASPTALTYLSDIVGVREKVAGTAKEISGYKVVDPKTIRITIDKPRPYFLGKLTYPTASVTCKDVNEAGSEILSLKAMIGTGPFKAERYEPGQIFAMTANADYHGGAPKLKGIERPILKEGQTRLNKFRTGALDLTRIERQDIEGLKRDAALKDQIRYFSRASLYYVGMNCDMLAPFKDRRVRQAIGMAIDRKAIVDETLGGANEIANGILPPGVFGHRPDVRYPAFDPAKAKELLKEAGVTPDSFGKLIIYHRDGQPDVKLVAERVATDLRTNLGIDCKASMQTWSSYLDKHTKKQLPFFHMRWGADYLDAENFLSNLLASHGAENKINYKNPEFDALCARADTLVGNDEERKRLYAQAEDLVLADAPFIPIYFQRDAELVAPRVKDMRESVFGHLPHTTTRIE